MKVLMVTGGAGFIGSNFIKYYKRVVEDCIIINYDKLTYAGNLKNVQELEGSPGYYFVKGDICDPKQVSRVIRECDPDYVINFAAESDVARSIDDPFLFGRTNGMGTLNLLTCFKNYWEDRGYAGKLFIQVSADQLYAGNIDKSRHFSAESNLWPANPYSASKAGAELMAEAYFKSFKLPVIITRCCNTYGPYQHREKYIPNCIIRALKNEPIPFYGDGTNIRKWIHVNDHCSALTEIIRTGEPGQLYNIGGGEEISDLEIAGIILRYVRQGIICHPNSSKEKCGYSLHEGIKETIKWYESFPEIWDN